MSIVARRIGKALALTGLLVLHAWTAHAQGGDGLADLTGIELRKDAGLLKLHFLISAPPKFEVVDNLPKRVLIIKFQGVRTAFPAGKRHFLFNDPMVEGVAFERIGERDVWAKVRLRTPNLAYQILPPPHPNQMVLAFSAAPPSRLIQLTQVRLTTQQGASQVVFELSRLPQYEADRAGANFSVRLKGVIPRLRTPLQGEDDRLELTAIEREDDDALVQIRLKRTDVQVVPRLFTETDPPRLVFTFRDLPPGAVAPPPLEAEPEAPPRQPGESLEALLAAEPRASLRANYTLAEREFRAGKFRPSRQDFLRVFNASPRSKLGIRAYFRAADAQYELLRRQKARNYHGVIINYQIALRAAEKAGYESELIPHAIFRIARSYQHMNFHNEAHVHFKILQDRFPDNEIYTVDSFFYQGRSFTQTRRHEQAIEALGEFLSRDGDPGLIGPAFYAVGDAYYNLKRFPEAKREFNRGRRKAPEYPNTRPVLLFHMGETYYENAEFDTARTIYRILLERFPNKPYTKLVGLRLGDFMRDEGKETEALRLYGQVVENSPLEIRLRGKIRIADIFTDRPVGDDYKKALKLYDEVIAEGKGRPIVQDAYMRKALALTLHNSQREAIAAFLTLREKFPESPFVRHKIVLANIVENLKALVDRLFAEEAYWEVAKVFTTYRETFFREFPHQITLFQVARSYHFLGLYDEALRHYDRILAGRPGSLAPLLAFQQATVHADKDDLGKAEEGLLKFIQANPEGRYTTDARVRLGNVYFEGRRYEDAMKAYRIIQRDFEKDQDPRLGEALPEVLYQLGRIFKELGRLKESVEAFRGAVDNYHHPLQGEGVPEYVVLSQYTVGDVLFKLDQDQDAVKSYEIAIARYPDHDKTPWARFQIGLIHRRNGREKEALNIFNGLVELAKTRPGELWETLARENQRDLVNSLGFQEYLKQ